MDPQPPPPARTEPLSGAPWNGKMAPLRAPMGGWGPHLFPVFVLFAVWWTNGSVMGADSYAAPDGSGTSDVAATYFLFALLAVVYYAGACWRILARLFGWAGLALMVLASGFGRSRTLADTPQTRYPFCCADGPFVATLDVWWVVVAFGAVMVGVAIVLQLTQHREPRFPWSIPILMFLTAVTIVGLILFMYTDTVMTPLR